ncbi:MAG: class II glutamine amidotransferase [Clostridiales bacterium]|nr:class II glutamine amidotransferase [Clostridiales bacterium]
MLPPNFPKKSRSTYCRCELLAVSSEKKLDVKKQLKTFFSHADQNPDGWGLATWDDDGEVLLVKEAVNASRSEIVSDILESKCVCSGLFAHIRKATIGHVEYLNTHPFEKKDANGTNWVLAHNGTIFESSELDPYFKRQQGTTDSERILLYLLDQVEGIKDEKKRFDLIDEIIVRLSDKNKLNLLLFDGKNVYVHKNEENTMYQKSEDGYTIFSTKPLDDGNWTSVPMNQLQIYRDGQKIYEGTIHDHTYVFDEEHMRMLYLAYSEL